MARSQDLPPLVALLLLLTGFTIIQSCHPNSKELHICLNIYLERDFPFIETIVEAQQKQGYGGVRGRVLLEGPDLENICRQIGLLQTCYDKLVNECDSYWQLGRYLTMMSAFNSSYFYLCGNTTDNMKDLLLNSACLSRAAPLLKECSTSGIHWFTTWKQILRLQADADSLCPLVSDYKECLLRKLKSIHCGKEAARVYYNFLNNWVDHWCSGEITYKIAERSNFRASQTKPYQSSGTEPYQNSRTEPYQSSGTEFLNCKFTLSYAIVYISLKMWLTEHSL